MSKKKIFFKILKIIVSLIIIVIIDVIYLEIKGFRPNPTQEVVETCEIDEEEYNGYKVYTISPKENKDITGKTIIYFHGGSYMAEMTDKYWNFIKKLVLDTHITVIIPSYPIAPKYRYTDTIDFSEAAYKKVINEKGSENVIAMGDSAGGGLVLALEEKILSEETELNNSNTTITENEKAESKNEIIDNIKKDNNYRTNDQQSNSIENIQKSTNIQNLPKSTILISPWLDVSMTNEKINEIQKYDKNLNKEKLLAAGIVYARGTDTKNYLVSPIYGDLSNLKNITILTGTYDILNPDVHLLIDKAKDVNVKINIKEYEKATHIWIIEKNCEKKLISDGYNYLKDLLLR